MLPSDCTCLHVLSHILALCQCMFMCVCVCVCVFVCHCVCPPRHSDNHRKSGRVESQTTAAVTLAADWLLQEASRV